MKRHTKKTFGFFGLLLVMATTVFAMTLPSPEAIAAATTSDTIVVRVVGETTHVEFTDVTSGEELLAPVKTFPFIYDNAETVTITLEYTNVDGSTEDFVLDTIDAGGIVGSGALNINLADAKYGYGEYVLKIRGQHPNSMISEDSIEFSFYPFAAKLEEGEQNDNADLDLNYDSSTGIKNFKISVKRKGGAAVSELPDMTVTPPETSVEIPFATNEAPAGEYVVSVTSEDNVGRTFTRNIDYEYSATKVPNTGGLFSGLNIAKSDYLITGLIIFFLIGVGAIIFVAKAGKSSKKRR